jgi:predicted AlkP superfamily phosphohydrolase/phosphomutase
MTEARLLLIGLDCASPDLVFGRWRSELPVLSGLMDGGTWGPLHSVHPPVTLPAWSAMVTGRDPGELGLYGFRSRRDRSYAAPRLHDSTTLRAPTLWDRLGAAGKASIVVGFPQSYPVRPIRGCLVSGMLTPSTEVPFTWPHALSEEVLRWAPGYQFDATLHRGGDPERLADEVFAMTRARFGVFRELLRREPWTLAFLHEIGLDRLQHALWHALDAPESDGYRRLREYHHLLDAEIGEILDMIPDGTAVCVASDHGAQRFEGAFAINEWLIQEGYLVLDDKPEPGTPLSPEIVDWSRTRAWADGGYAGRLYLNIRDREPEGTLTASGALRLQTEIRAKLEALSDPAGNFLGNAVYLPEEVYARCAGIPPDLLIYPGDLRLRCAGTVGHPTPFLSANDTGPDTANHAWEGLFVTRDARGMGSGRIEGTGILDIAPDLLGRLEGCAGSRASGGRLA